MKSVMGFLAMPVKIRLRLDSSAAKAVCQRIGVGRIRHLEVRSLWLQGKVKDKQIVVYKQDGETNIGDIGTKNLAGPRFKWMREQIGRVMLGDTSNVQEAKAVRVNMITNRTGGKRCHEDAMQKIGCALIVLMECMTRATAASAGDECDGRLAHEAGADAGSDWLTFGFLLILVAAVFAAGFMLGRTCAPAAARSPGMRAGAETKDQVTQSQTTYLWAAATPRFKLLAEHAHGGWSG